MKLEFEDGKYIYINDESGQRVLRYGEPWREITGDKFTYLMASSVEQLQARVAELEELVEGYRKLDVANFELGQYQREVKAKVALAANGAANGAANAIRSGAWKEFKQS